MEGLGDEDLVAQYRAASGSGERFLDELFRRYHKRVATWCYRFTGDRESAADLAQEIFMKAYRHLDSFRGDSKFSTWMYSIARNHCTNASKARAARPEQSSDALLLELPDGRTESIENALERLSTARSARALLVETLDETELKVMTLHFGEEVGLEAITRLLGLTNASGAKAYVVSARRKLRVAVERWKAKHSRGIR